VWAGNNQVGPPELATLEHLRERGTRCNLDLYTETRILQGADLALEVFSGPLLPEELLSAQGIERVQPRRKVERWCGDARHMERARADDRRREHRTEQPGRLARRFAELHGK
jgi:hypothetical protein